MIPFTAILKRLKPSIRYLLRLTEQRQDSGEVLHLGRIAEQTVANDISVV